MAEVLQNLSDALAAAVADAGQYTVRVEARRRMPASGIVWSAEGVIVTAHHVVSREENIKVGLPDGKVVSAAFVGRDPTTDIAVLRAEASGLSAAAWLNPQELRVGHLAMAVGRPGDDVQATLGVVSALGEGWRTGAGGHIDAYLQTDVVMYPGFSGGPLVGAGAKLLGMNSSALMRGVSLALPAPTLSRVVDALLTHGRIQRGYLGVGIQPVRLPEAISTALEGQEAGVMLVSVEAGGPAATGGLSMGDTIVTLGGQPVRGFDELQAALSGDKVGQSVPVRIVRGGELIEKSVTIGEHPGEKARE